MRNIFKFVEIDNQFHIDTRQPHSYNSLPNQHTLYKEIREMAIKNVIRRSISLMLAGLITASVCSCSAGAAGGSGKLRIVTTIFPEYDWVRNIAGDNISNIDLKLLCDNGVDMHSFQPTAADIISISSCMPFNAAMNSPLSSIVYTLSKIKWQSLSEWQLTEGVSEFHG